MSKNYNQAKKIFGENVWKYRTKAELSQEELGFRIEFDNRFMAELKAELEKVMREQGRVISERIRDLEVRKRVIERKMDAPEDQIITKLFHKIGLIVSTSH